MRWGAEHTRLGRTGLHVSRLCLGTMTFGLQCDEAASHRHPRPRVRRRHHVPRYLGRLSDRRHAGDRRPHRGDHRALARRRAGTRSSSPRSASAPRARGRGIAGSRASTSSTRSTRRCAACAPTTSISTRRIIPIPRRRSTRRCARSTTSCAPGRRATSAARTIPRGRPRARSAAASCSGVARFDCVQPRYNLLFRQPERELLPLCQEEGARRHPVQPARGRVPLRQASAGEPAPRRARASRSATPRSATRSATGRSASSRPSMRSVRSRSRRACRSRGSRSPGCSRIP